MSRREIAAALAGYLVVQVIGLVLMFTVMSSPAGNVTPHDTRVCWQADSQRYCWSPELRTDG